MEVEWVEGDAEALPFEDESFDVVISTFGSMFAPRHDVTARVPARVLRPGGRMGLCNWTPEGAIGDFFRTLGSHLPPPPDLAHPPLLWGDEDHVGRLFEGSGVELSFEREELVMRFRSAGDAIEEYEARFGPVVKARELLEPEGRWPALRDEMVSMFERHDGSSGDGLAFHAEYLVVLGRKR